MEGNGHIATDNIVKLSGLSVVNSCLPWHFTRVNIKNDNSETSSIIYGPDIGVKYIFRVVSTCPCGCRFEILVNYGKELSQTLSGKSLAFPNRSPDFRGLCGPKVIYSSSKPELVSYCWNFTFKSGKGGYNRHRWHFGNRGQADCVGRNNGSTKIGVSNLMNLGGTC